MKRIRQNVVNWALAALAAALVVVVVVTGGSVTTSEKEARSFNVLAAWRDNEISRVSITRGNDVVRLERKGGGDGGDATWYIKQPYEEEADPFSVDKLLGTLQYASWVRSIKPEQVDRSAFGLDAPRMVIEIAMGDITYRLRLGKEAASPAGSAYMEITGEGAPRKGVVIIGKSLLEELNVKVDDFRGRYIMPYLSPVLERIDLSGVGGVRHLKKGPWGGFQFDGMANDARTNRQALDAVLLQFARTTADVFLDPAEAEKAQAGATETVVVAMTPEAKRKLPPGRVVVGGRCPKSPDDIIALRTAPDRLAGCVPANVLRGLGTPVDALIDRSLFWMRPDEVESIEVVDGDKKLSLDRKGEGFIMREPRTADVDGEAGTARLEGILRATGKLIENPDFAKLGVDKPKGRITVHSAAAQESKVKVETVLVSAPASDGSVYAKREHDGLVIELGRDAARSLRADASLVRSRKIFDFAVDDVVHVDIDNPRQAFARDTKGAVTLEYPEGFQGDAGLATELIDALRTLTADRWVSDQDDGSFGFQEPTLRAKFETKKGDTRQEHVVTLGAPAAAGYYAKVAGDPGVFVLPRRVYEVLTTLVLDRSVFMVDPAQTERIMLSTPERKVVLDKRGEQFVQSGGDEQLPDAAVQRIVDALAVMRAEAAIAIGPEKAEHGFATSLLTVRVERSSGAPQTEPLEWKVGAGDSWRGISIHYARARGINATFAVARSAVQPVIDSL